MLDRGLVIALLSIGAGLGGLAPLDAVAAGEADAGTMAVPVVAPAEAMERHAVVPASHQVDAASEPKLSDAERIARLQRTHDSDQKHRAELQAELDNLEKEYRQADVDFQQLDGQLEAARRDSAKAPAELATKWNLAKQRFELAIREKKALQASIATLETKMARDQGLIDELLKPTTAEPTAEVSQPVGDAPSEEPAAAGPTSTADAGASSGAAGLVVSGMVGSLVPLPQSRT
jgi:moderate conductance mechanosensitive channel